MMQSNDYEKLYNNDKLKSAKTEAAQAKATDEKQLVKPEKFCKNRKIIHLAVNQNKKPKRTENTPIPCNVVDQDTLCGHFGWALVGNEYLPFIFRAGRKHCPVRIIEMTVLKRFIHRIHQDIYSCVSVESYYMTKEESDLLNEINFKHCDCKYGPNQFTTRDLIVALDDVKEFYNFLDTCLKKLTNCSGLNPIVKCGFMRINKESLVPYVIYNNNKYVPLFYFEGEIEVLKSKAVRLKGWDLSYLKFCCKLQGVRNELFSHDSCFVVTLSDIQNYFPPGTLFEDCWPKECFTSNLLTGTNIQDIGTTYSLAASKPIRMESTQHVNHPTGRMYIWSNWNTQQHTSS